MKPIRAFVVFPVLIVLFGTGMSHALALEGPAGEAIAILRDPSRSLEERLNAAWALSLLGPEVKSVEPVLLQMLLSKTDLLVDPSDPLVKQLSGGKAIPDPPDLLLRAAVAMLLSHFVPEPGSVPALTALLRDENGLVYTYAAYALSNFGAEARPAVPALREALRSDDSNRAEMATFVLARIAPDPAVESVVPLLIEMLEGRKGWITGFNAAVALLKLGREEGKARAILRDEARVGHMLFLLSHGPQLVLMSEGLPLNRLHVCEALTLFGPPHRNLLDQLRKTAAEDPDARVREAALKALRKVGAAERGAMPDAGPKALATLPPELAEPGRALIESQKALGDQDDSLTGLRLLGGTREGDSATIDFFRWSGMYCKHGTVTMAREGGRWAQESISDYFGQSEPGIDDSTPLGLRETAAVALLKAVAAAQIHHWYKTSPATYADSLAKLDLPDRTPGFIITLTAGAKSNGIFHAWSAEAHPAGYPETGVHSYYTDERGVILQSDTRGLPLALEMPEH